MIFELLDLVREFYRLTALGVWYVNYMILANVSIDMFCRVMDTTFYDLSRSYVLLHEKKLFYIGQYVDICTL